MPRSEQEYAAALGPRPADDPSVQALDKAEAEAAKAREADRAARAARRAAKRGGAGPHTGL